MVQNFQVLNKISGIRCFVQLIGDEFRYAFVMSVDYQPFPSAPVLLLPSWAIGWRSIPDVAVDELWATIGAGAAEHVCSINEKSFFMPHTETRG